MDIKTEDRNAYTAVLTVVGKDQPGIIYQVTEILARHNVNIQDISQTIIRDVFNMIMLIDTSKADISFGDLGDALEKKAGEINCRIILQRRDVFISMHRI